MIRTCPIPGASDIRARHAAGGSGRTAILLPGLDYDCGRPLLASMRRVFEALDATVWKIDLPYARRGTFEGVPRGKAIARIAADGGAIARWAMCAADGAIWLVGKSIGTIAMGGALEAMPADAPLAGLVWLTPSPWVLGAAGHAARGAERSIVVIGTRDDACRADLLGPVETAGARVAVVDGVDHAFDHAAGAEASVAALDHVADLIARFVDRADEGGGPSAFTPPEA